jgi:hypothetical protein
MKAHIYASESPLDNGATIQTLCGLTIFQCKKGMFWDEMVMNEPLALSTILFCRKCCDAAGLIENRPRYIYGVCEEKDSHGQTEKLGSGPIPSALHAENEG